MPTDRPRDAPGVICHAVPGYELREQIGGGGQGVVYRAHRDRDGAIVAIKLMRAGPAASREEHRRFEREAAVLRDQAHPGIVEFLDEGVTANGHSYIVMEYVEGKRLDVRGWRATHRDPEIRVSKAIQLAKLLCGPVAALHASGLVHRDLKPGNVLLLGGGQLRLIDMGLVTASDPVSRAAAPLTRVGAGLGTEPYASPEQWRGLPGSALPASDVFSIAVITCELILGEAPFQPGLGSDDSYTRAHSTALQKLRRYRVGPRLALARDLVGVLARALEPDPGRRIPDAAALRQALDGCALFRPGPSRHRPLVISTSLAAALLALAHGVGPRVPWARTRPVEAAPSAARIAKSPGPRELVSTRRLMAKRLTFDPARVTLRAASAEVAGADVWDLTSESSTSTVDVDGTPYDTFSPDGRYLYSPGLLRDLRNGSQIELRDARDCERACFSGDGTLVAPLGAWPDSALRVYRTSDGAEVFRRRFSYGPVAQLDLSYDGTRLVVAGGAPQVGLELFDVTSGEALGPIAWRGGAQARVLFSPDGSEFGAFHWGKLLVAVYDGRDGSKKQEIFMGSFSGSNKDRLFATGQGFQVVLHDASGNAVGIWDVARNILVADIALERPVAVASILSPRGDGLLVAEGGGRVVFWSLGATPTPRDLRASGSPVLATALSPDGRWAAGAFLNGTVSVWELAALAD